MPSVQPDYWTGAPGLQHKARCNNMRCKQWIELEPKYTVSMTGQITPEPVHCPHCGWSQGPLRLYGYPPIVDFTK